MKSRLLLVAFYCWAYALAAQKPGYIVWTIDWNPKEPVAAVGGDDSLLRFFQIPELMVVETVRVPTMIRFVQWHPDGRLLAIATARGIFLFDFTTKQLVKWPNAPAARALDWKPTGDQLVVADLDGKVTFWSRDGVLLRSIQKITNGETDMNSFFSVDWHPTKNIVVTGGDEIRIYSSDGREVNVVKHRKEQTGVLSVQWHPSGSFFVSGDYGHHSEGVESLIQFWSGNGKLINTLNGSISEYRNLRWNKSGTRLATASDALRLWNEQASNLFASPSNTAQPLWGISWHRDGQALITSSSNGVISLWDSNGRLLRTTRRDE